MLSSSIPSVLPTLNQNAMLRLRFDASTLYLLTSSEFSFATLN
jgi:hypothetical protein